MLITTSEPPRFVASSSAALARWRTGGRIVARHRRDPDAERSQDPPSIAAGQLANLSTRRSSPATTALPLGASRMIPYSPRPTGASLSDSRREVRKRWRSRAGAPRRPDRRTRSESPQCRSPWRRQPRVARHLDGAAPPHAADARSGAESPRRSRPGTCPTERPRRAAAWGHHWHAASWDPSLACPPLRLLSAIVSVAQCRHKVCAADIPRRERRADAEGPDGDSPGPAR